MQTRPQPTREQLLATVKKSRWIALGVAAIFTLLTLATTPVVLWTSSPGEAIRAVVPALATFSALLWIVFGCVCIPASTGARTGLAIGIASAAAAVTTVVTVIVVVDVASAGEITPALTTGTLYLAALGASLAALSPVIALHAHATSVR